MSKDSFFLGVDTSNYTTSLALVKNGKIIKNTRRLLPVGENERGLRQSDALFHHTKALPELCAQLFDGCDEYSKDALCGVGVSTRPRNCEGSYMPCFLAGVSFATAISKAMSIPLFALSHQQGHIAAALYESGLSSDNEKEFVAFHVSGGTTDIILCKKENGDIFCERIGGTNDLNAGQAIDRTGVLMGIPFPCGKKLDEMAQGSDADFGKIKVSVNGLSCSLSGLENKTKELISKKLPQEDIAAFLFEYLSCVLAKLSANVRESYKDIPILFAGGVMSNTRIRKNLSKLSGVFFAKSELSSDNACGCALIASEKFQTEI